MASGIGGVQGASQHEFRQILTTEHGVAAGKIGPYILLKRRQPGILPMPPCSTSRSGQRHCIFHWPNMSQRIGLYLHGTHLRYEPHDVPTGGGIFSELEQPHSNIKSVIGRTPIWCVRQCQFLPYRCDCRGIPRNGERITWPATLLRRQIAQPSRYLADQRP